MAVRSKDIKRSVTLDGHRTSVALEPEFWQAIKDIASAERRSLNGLITYIDKTRRPEAGNLSRAIRLYVLAYFRHHAPLAAASDWTDEDQEASP